MHGIFVLSSQRLAAPLNDRPLGVHWLADRPIWQMLISGWGTSMSSVDLWVPADDQAAFASHIEAFPPTVPVQLQTFSGVDGFPAAEIEPSLSDIESDMPVVLASGDTFIIPSKRFDGVLDVDCGRFGTTSLVFSGKKAAQQRWPMENLTWAGWTEAFEVDADLAADRVIPLLDQAGQTDNAALLYANHRLLSMGYHSNDALERSYVEEFAVIPPVFIAADAEIYTSVIGPYASIGPGARVENCIVQQSVIDEGSAISTMLLGDSYISKGSSLEGSFSNIQMKSNDTAQSGESG